MFHEGALAWGAPMTKVDWTNWFLTHPPFRPLARPEAKAEFLEHLERGTGGETCEEVTYGGGEPIIEQGQPADFIYFIGKGRVKVSVLGPDRQPIELGSLESGDFFGELGMLPDRERPRSATVTAEGNCVILRLDAARLDDALTQYPEVRSAILLQLIGRLRRLAERLAEEAYQAVDNKVQLLGAKLDAELHAVNASLTASQTVFEQTTTWANEVLAKGERFWTRATWAGSIVGGGFAVIVAVAGLIGYESFDRVLQRANEQLGTIDDTATRVHEIASRADSAASDAERTYKEINQVRESLVSGASLVILPQMFDRVLGITKSQSELSAARTLFGAAIRSGDAALSRQVFAYLQQEILLHAADFENRSLSSERSTLEPIRHILSEVIESKNDKSIDPNDTIMAYYLSLITLVMDGNFEQYEHLVSELVRYRRRYPVVIGSSDLDLFDPKGIILILKSLKPETIDTELRRKMIYSIDRCYRIIVDS